MDVELGFTCEADKPLFIVKCS